MNFETLKCELDSRGVLSVTLNRPEIRNAFNERMIQELTTVFGTKGSYALDPKTRVITFQGAGDVFSAGGDLNWMKKSKDLSFEGNLEDTRRLSRMFVLMNECPRPIVAAIQGAAIGGGVGLVSVCDSVIAVKDTQFSLSEVRLGLVPACIAPFVISKIGASHARALFTTAERFLGDKALAIGLVHDLVNDQTELAEKLKSRVSNMLECGPTAMTAAKKVVADLAWPERRVDVKSYEEYVSRLLAELRVSPEGQEGLSAFLEKRKPSWI